LQNHEEDEQTQTLEDLGESSIDASKKIAFVKGFAHGARDCGIARAPRSKKAAMKVDLSHKGITALQKVTRNLARKEFDKSLVNKKASRANSPIKKRPSGTRKRKFLKVDTSPEGITALKKATQNLVRKEYAKKRKGSKKFLKVDTSPEGITALKKATGKLARKESAKQRKGSKTRANSPHKGASPEKKYTEVDLSPEGRQALEKAIRKLTKKEMKAHNRAGELGEGRTGNLSSKGQKKLRSVIRKLTELDLEVEKLQTGTKSHKRKKPPKSSSQTSDGDLPVGNFRRFLRNNDKDPAWFQIPELNQRNTKTSVVTFVSNLLAGAAVFVRATCPIQATVDDDCKARLGVLLRSKSKAPDMRPVWKSCATGPSDRSMGKQVFKMKDEDFRGKRCTNENCTPMSVNEAVQTVAKFIQGLITDVHRRLLSPEMISPKLLKLARSGIMNAFLRRFAKVDLRKIEADFNKFVSNLPQLFRKKAHFLSPQKQYGEVPSAYTKFWNSKAQGPKKFLNLGKRNTISQSTRPAPQLPGQFNFNTCGWEGDTCECKGTVKYGLGSKWKFKASSGKILCSAAVFGDPAPGKKKHCRCKGTEAWRDPESIKYKDDKCCALGRTYTATYDFRGAPSPDLKYHLDLAKGKVPLTQDGCPANLPPRNGGYTFTGFRAVWESGGSDELGEGWGRRRKSRRRKSSSSSTRRRRMFHISGHAAAGKKKLKKLATVVKKKLKKVATVVRNKLAKAVTALTGGLKKRLMAKLLRLASKAKKIFVQELRKRWAWNCLLPAQPIDEDTVPTADAMKKAWSKTRQACKLMGEKYSGGSTLVNAVFTVIQRLAAREVSNNFKRGTGMPVSPWQSWPNLCQLYLQPVADPKLRMVNSACKCYESRFCPKEDQDCHRKRCPCRYLYTKSASSEDSTLVASSEYVYHMSAIPESGVVGLDDKWNKNKIDPNGKNMMYHTLQREKPLIVEVVQLHPHGKYAGLPVCKFRFKMDMKMKMRPQLPMTAVEKNLLKECMRDPFTLGNDQTARRNFALQQRRCLNDIVFKQSGASGKYIYDNLDCSSPTGFVEKILQGRIDYAAGQGDKDGNDLKRENYNCKASYTMLESIVRVGWGLKFAWLNFNMDKCFDQRHMQAEGGQELGESEEKVLKVDLSSKGTTAIKKEIKHLTRKALDKAAPPGSKVQVPANMNPSSPVLSSRRVKQILQGADKKGNHIDLSPKGIVAIQAAIKNVAQKELDRVGLRKRNGFLERRGQSRTKKSRQTTEQKKPAQVSLANKNITEEEVFHLGYHAGCKSKKPKWFTEAGKAKLSSEIRNAWKQAIDLSPKEIASIKTAATEANNRLHPKVKPTAPSVVVDKSKIQEWRNRLRKEPRHSCQVPWFMGGQCVRDDGNCIPELINGVADREANMGLYKRKHAMNSEVNMETVIGSYTGVVKHGMLLLRGLAKLLCVGPKYMNFGFIKDNMTASDRFCCAEGQKNSFSTPGTPRAIRLKTWQTGWSQGKIPKQVKQVCQRVGGCKSTTTRYAAWLQTCDNLTGQYERGCHMRRFFPSTKYAAYNPMASAFRQKLAAYMKGGKKLRREDFLLAKSGLGYFPADKLAYPKMWLKNIKKKKLSMALGIFGGLVPWLISKTTGNPTAALACACNNNMGAWGNFDFAWSITGRYCKGDVNNCDKEDAMYMSTIKGDPKAKAYTRKHHLRKPLAGPMQFKVRTVRLTGVRHRWVKFDERQTECVFGAVASLKLCKCSPGAKARATQPELQTTADEVLPITCGCADGLFQKSMKVTLDYYAKDDPRVQKRCKALFGYVDAILRSIWVFGTGAVVMQAFGANAGKALRGPLKWIYTNDGWKTRVGGGTYDKYNPAKPATAVSPFYVHAFNPKKELKVAKESEYRPYYPKLRILKEGSTVGKPRVFECPPDPDCEQGVYVRDSMNKGKPRGRPCQCYPDDGNEPAYVAKTPQVYKTSYRVENPEKPWNYEHALRGSVGDMDLEGYGYKLPTQQCLAPLGQLPSSEFMGGSRL